MVDKYRLLSHIVKMDRNKALKLKQINIHFEGEEDLYYEFTNSLSENLWSISKTFTSIAIGIAVDENKIKLDEYAIKYFPEFESICTANNSKIRVIDLLHMNSGKDGFLFREASEVTTEDYAAIFFKEDLVRPSGSGFNYNNMNTYILSRIIENIYEETLRDFLTKRLFEPLGYFNVQWDTCPNNHTYGCSGLHLKTFELARLGILLLNKGVYEGNRIISAEYIRQMHEDLVDTPIGDEAECNNGYGYQVWKCTFEDAYRADGAYGQYVIVYPSRSAVITATATNLLRGHDIVRLAHEIVAGNY